MKNSTFIILIAVIAVAAYFLLGKKESSTKDESDKPISDERAKEIEELRALLQKESEGNALSEAEIKRLEELVRKSEQANREIEKAATERVIKAEADSAEKIAKAEAEATKWKDLLARNEEAASQYYDAIEKSSKDLEEALIRLKEYEELEDLERQRKEAEDRIAQAKAAKIEEQEWIAAWNSWEWINDKAIRISYDLNPSNMGWVDDVIREVLKDLNDKQMAILQSRYTINTGRNLISDLQKASMDPPYRTWWGAKQFRGIIGYEGDDWEYDTPSLIYFRDRLLSKLYNIPIAN